MLPAFNMLLGRSSQRQHVGVFSGTSLKPTPNIGVSLLFEDIRTKQKGGRSAINTTPRAAMSDDSDSNDSANRTFAIVKPDALTPFKYQQIDALIKLNEFQIVRQKLVWLTKGQADALFPEKTSDSDYQDWIDYITCAPSLVLELARENAALFWHITMGLGDSADGSSCDSDSIRGILAIDKIRNAVDGSGEPEDAVKQLALVFSGSVPEIPYDNFLMQHSVDAHSTLALIKPDVSSNAEAVSQVIRRITARGYSIKDRVEIQLTKAQASAFYAEHVGKPFFDGLIAHMTSGPVIALLVDGDDVIRGWRTMIGPTSPDAARSEVPQSIRALLGESGPRNAVHGSDSAESALRELSFFFSPRIQQQQEEVVEDEEEELQSESQNPSTIENSEQAPAEAASAEAAPAASTTGEDEEKKKKKRNKKSKRNNKRKQTVSSAGGDAVPVPKTAETTTTTTAVQSDNSDNEAAPLVPEQPESVTAEGGAIESTSNDTVEASAASAVSDNIEAQMPEAEDSVVSEQPAEQTVTETLAEPVIEQPIEKPDEPIPVQPTEPAVSPAEESADEPVAKQADEPNMEPEVEFNAEQADILPSVPDTLALARELLKPFEPTNERTFGLIKPDAYPRYYKQIITQAIEKGFTIVVQEEVQLTAETAEDIYRDMSTYPIFPRIISFVTSGPALALVLEGVDAISAWRSLVGPTNSRTAKIEARSSLRAKYGMDAQKNAVHASKDKDDALESVNAVFFNLLGGSFQKLLPTDDPLAVAVASQQNSDIGSAQTTPLAVPATTIPEEQPITPAEDTTADISQASNATETLVPTEIPSVSDEPVAADISSVPDITENPEILAPVEEPAVQEIPAAAAAASISAALEDPAVPAQTMPVGEAATADEPAASETPATPDVLSSTVEQGSAEAHVIDKEEPVCADEPATESPDMAAKIAAAEDVCNAEPTLEEKPAEVTATTPPQNKSSTVEKSTPFGKRLASSPFLQADRQLGQESNGVAKRVGRIKSPFLSNEASDGPQTSATIAASISSPPKSVAAIRSAFAKEPEAKADDDTRGLRIDHSPSADNTVRTTVDDSKPEVNTSRPATPKESAKAGDNSAEDQVANGTASTENTTTVDGAVEQNAEASTEADTNDDSATPAAEEAEKMDSEDASKAPVQKAAAATAADTTAKATSTPTKDRAPAKAQTPTKTPVASQSRTATTRPAAGAVPASKTPVRKGAATASTASPARPAAFSTTGRSPSKPPVSAASTARRPIATTASSTPLSSRTRPTAPSVPTAAKVPSSAAAGATPRAGTVRRAPVSSTTAAPRSTGTGNTPVRSAPGRVAPSSAATTRTPTATASASAATRTRPTAPGAATATATASASKAPLRTATTAPTSASTTSARSRGSTSSSTSTVSAPRRPLTKPVEAGSTAAKKPLTTTSTTAATGAAVTAPAAARRTTTNGSRVSSTTTNGASSTPVRRPAASAAPSTTASTAPRPTTRPAVPSAARQPPSTTATARTRPAATAPARDAGAAAASRTTAPRTTTASRPVTTRTPAVPRASQTTSAAPAARKPVVPSAASAGRPIARISSSSAPGAARPVTKRVPVPASVPSAKPLSAKKPVSLPDPDSAQKPEPESESVTAGNTESVDDSQV